MSLMFLAALAKRPWPDSGDGWILTRELLTRGLMLSFPIAAGTSLLIQAVVIILQLFPQAILLIRNFEYSTVMAVVVVLTIGSMVASLYLSLNFIIYFRRVVGPVMEIEARKKHA